MYKQMLFVMALLFASTANAECYVVNNKTVCVEPVLRPSRGIDTMSDVLRQRQQQQRSIEQGSISQKAAILKNSLNTLPENSRKQLFDELYKLPKNELEALLEILVVIPEADRLEILSELARNPKENIQQLLKELYALAQKNQ